MTALRPATWPREETRTRLLLVDPASRVWRDAHLDDLERLLRAGDLVVVNDAATLPASLAGTAGGAPIEARLAGAPRDEAGREWTAVVLGAGSWRERTEDRPPPPALRPGQRVELGSLRAEVLEVSSVSPRLVVLRFDRGEEPLWSALFRTGRPVQYAYVRDELRLWHVQTAYAGRPVAVEMPSAGRPLRLPLVRALRNRGVGLARVTHAAGLSSTGDPAIDAALPLPERSEVPPGTVEAVRRAKAAGGRVVAVGTSVVRALEAAWHEPAGALRGGTRLATLRVAPGFVPRVVDGILTGIHEPGESHFELLQAFAPRELLEAALAHAADAGYFGHEFGDSSLVLPGLAAASVEPGRLRRPA